MRLRLKKAARIQHQAGETVEVSPAEARFLLAVGAAVIEAAPVVETPEPPKRETRKRKK